MQENPEKETENPKPLQMVWRRSGRPKKLGSTQLPMPRSVRFTQELDDEVEQYLIQNDLAFNQLCQFAVRQYISQKQTLELRPVGEVKMRESR